MIVCIPMASPSVRLCMPSPITTIHAMLLMPVCPGSACPWEWPCPGLSFWLADEVPMTEYRWLYNFHFNSYLNASLMSENEQTLQCIQLPSRLCIMLSFLYILVLKKKGKNVCIKINNPLQLFYRTKGFI